MNSYNLKMGADDPEHIDATNSWEINYWTSQLKCSKEELLTAARESGSKIADIRKFIQLINTVEKKRK